jgi:Acetyltransferase (GNAT) domain
MELETKIKAVEDSSAAAAWRRPDSVVLDKPNWFQVTTPSSKRFWLNGIHRSVLTEHGAKKMVEVIAEKYRNAGQEFRWIVGPSARPKNLPQLLDQSGIRHHGLGIGMVAETETFPGVVLPNIRVEVTTLKNLNDYVEAASAGWDMSEAVTKEMFSDMSRDLQDPHHNKQYFIGYKNNEPAGTGAMLMGKDFGYLMGGSVAPQFRGAGVYRSLVAERMRLLRERHIPLATIQAKDDSSAPICKKLGFESVCEVNYFLATWS